MGEILATRSLQPKSKHDYGCGGQAASAHYQLAEKVDSRCAAPKGASDFEGLTVSLKRYPDTKPEFFRKLIMRRETQGVNKSNQRQGLRRRRRPWSRPRLPPLSGQLGAPMAVQWTRISVSGYVEWVGPCGGSRWQCWRPDRP